jgi:membrane protease YdiL (CAAX protease family)
MTPAALLLLAAGPALWWRPAAAVALLALAGLAALVDRTLTPAAALSLLAFAGLAAAYARAAEPRRRWLLWAALLLAAAALYLHLVPGFAYPRVLGPLTVGAGAPDAKHLSFDKTAAGILLLAVALPGLYARTGWRDLLRRAAPWLLATPALLTLLALAAGLGWDPTPVAAFLPWAVLNLLTTCLPEEALFRGLFQSRLTAAAAARGIPAAFPIAATAIVFGLAHLPGGPAYAALATLAGLGYGLAFHATGRIEAAILCHFAVNATHFLLLTYPYPAS